MWCACLLGSRARVCPWWMLGSGRGVVENEWWLSGLTTPGHPGKQGQEALPCLLREHGQSGSFCGWGWETA